VVVSSPSFQSSGCAHFITASTALSCARNGAEVCIATEEYPISEELDILEVLETVDI
jgi:hypothetical protein